jgi:hypothetical protein
MDSENHPQQSEMMEIKLRFAMPEGMPSRHAHHLIVQVTDFEVVLMFFEVQMPVLYGSEEQQKNILDEMGGLRAYCVSKISVPKALYPAMAAVMSRTAANMEEGGDPLAAVKM